MAKEIIRELTVSVRKLTVEQHSKRVSESFEENVAPNVRESELRKIMDLLSDRQSKTETEVLRM